MRRARGENQNARHDKTTKNLLLRVHVENEENDKKISAALYGQ